MSGQSIKIVIWVMYADQLGYRVEILNFCFAFQVDVICTVYDNK